jgi:hypothetical protein
VTNIPDVGKCISFCVDVGQIVKSACKHIFKFGVRVHVASYKLISFFNEENILSACPDFGFAVEIDIAFANSDSRSVSHFMSEYFTTIFTYSHLFLLMHKKGENGNNMVESRDLETKRDQEGF